jgi:hypothetical protein
MSAGHFHHLEEIDMPIMPNRPAIVRAAEDQDAATIFKRINAREKKSHKDQLAHVKAQGRDLELANSKCKHGEWEKRIKEEGGMSPVQAWRYRTAYKSFVTKDLTEDQQWEEWQRISGNTPPAPPPPATPKAPTPVGPKGEEAPPGDGDEEENSGEEETEETPDGDGEEADGDQGDGDEEHEEAGSDPGNSGTPPVTSPPDASPPVAQPPGTGPDKPKTKRNNSDDPIPVRLKATKSKKARWDFMVKLAMKAFKTDKKFDAIFKALEFGMPNWPCAQ